MTETKRKLTAEEIERCLEGLGDQLVCCSPLLKETIVRQHMESLQAQLETVEIYPSLLPTLRKTIHSEFQQSMIVPGENVGVLCAQSIGEKQTQSTLNSFHAAGIAVQMVLTGVPRFMEILNATKDPKVSTSRFHLVEKNLNSIRAVREHLRHQIVHLTFGQLITSYTLFHHKQEEIWYQTFMMMYDQDFRDLEYGFSFQLNKKIMYQYFVPVTLLKKRLESLFQDIRIVFSPFHIGQLDVFVDVSDVDPPEDNTLFVNENNYREIFLKDVVLEKLRETPITGITGIQNIFIQRDLKTREWYVETVGNNFMELLGHPLLETSTVISNNMWDIYHCLGIEAARQFLFEELWNLVTSDGSFINPCHVMLLVDIMTHHGSIISISRYGMKKEQTGVLCRASFEESTDHFLNAAFFSEKEVIRGVSASIICGKRSRMGTGLCDLVMDLPAYSTSS